MTRPGRVGGGGGGAWFTRYVARLLARPPATGSEQLAVLGLLSVAIVALAWANLAGGRAINFSILYVIPSLVGAVLLSLWPGVYLAGAGALGWAIGSHFDMSQLSVSARVFDALIRFLGTVVAVLLVDTLRQTTAQALESDRRGRDLLSLVAHQMRTPVAGLRASAETLISIGATEDQESFLADIAANAARMGRLLNNLLWVARLDGGAEYPARPADPLALCRQELVRFEARRPDVEVELSGSAPRVVVTEDVLRETVANLLDNAARHARSRLIVALSYEASQVRVSVHDDGPGLPNGREEQAFSRFVSFDGGTGLGLSLCRSASRRAGGDLVYDRGWFRLHLPAQPTG